MIVALDVQYTATHAHGAAVMFAHWRSLEALGHYTVSESPVAEYQPGQFYLRELPPLLSLIRQIEPPFGTCIIDGYCHLSPERSPGLGAHLHAALARPELIVVGVAKRRYREAQHAVEVLRAGSRQPLFVTAIGTDSATAASWIEAMAGSSASQACSRPWIVWRGCRANSWN